MQIAADMLRNVLFDSLNVLKTVVKLSNCIPVIVLQGKVQALEVLRKGLNYTQESTISTCF